MHRWVYVCAIGLVAGVALRSLMQLSEYVSLFLLLIALTSLVLYKVERGTTVLPLVGLVVASLALGVIRMDSALLVRDPALLAVVDTEQVLEGVVVDDPDERENSTHITVRLTDVHGEYTDTKVLVYAPHYPKTQYGDVVRVEGTLALPERFETETGREFDYPHYLEKDGVGFVVYRPSITIVGTGKGNLYVSLLFQLKHVLLASISRTVPEPQAALLGGLLVGAKQSLGDAWLDAFRATGIVHIVVLSGYNVTIVAESIMRILALAPRFMSLAAGGGAIISFALLTGGSATIVRASIMALLIVLARYLHRPHGLFRALVVAGTIMVLHNPYILLFDPSFQLSFLATLGLIVLAPRFMELLEWVPAWLGLREIASATFATQLFVLPLLLYQVGQLSTVAPLVNVLVLPAIPLVMLTGFVTALLGLVSTLLAFPAMSVTYFILSYVFVVVDIGAHIPFASLTLPIVPLWGVGLLYALLVCVAVPECRMVHGATSLLRIGRSQRSSSTR